MKSVDILRPLLRCPYCQSNVLDTCDSSESSDLVCQSCSSQYKVLLGRPVMLRPDNELFKRNNYVEKKIPRQPVRKGVWRQLLPEPSVNLASKQVLGKLRQILEKMPSAVILVVGSGQQRHWLDKNLQAGKLVQLVYSDIDVSADVDLYCDGHDLPFESGVFDAVVTTAVLEHVLYPERVALEITRVLKVGGLLYSELPFMQQVHEGAYDFTRYTMSGHRRLFNSFAVIEGGMVAGPGTALVWALEHFFSAFVRHAKLRMIAKGCVRLLFSWIKYFDFILKNSPAAMDGASCTYLLGRKVDIPAADIDIVNQYVGGQSLRHT